MNPNNYASLEASKRLVEAGIVIETEAVWRHKRDKTGYYLSRKALYHRPSDIPAPSMAEVWRELPEGSHIHKWAKSIAGYCFNRHIGEPENGRTNLTAGEHDR